MTAQSLNDLITDGNVAGRTVLIRSDLNVPLDGQMVTDDGRIQASLPAITRLADAGARVIVMAHLGRPQGQADFKFSLAPVAARMGQLSGRTIHQATDVTGASAQKLAAELANGDILLLENVRFDPRETSENRAERTKLAKEFAALAAKGHGTGAYVGDAFGAVHRKHASVYDLATELPNFQGPLVAAEFKVLSQLVGEPRRPYVVALGGSKVSDKLAVIDHLMDRADTLLIGGGMAFTFLKAQGYDVGASLLEEDQIPVVAEYLKRADEVGCRILLPTDIVMASAFSAEAEHEVLTTDSLATGAHGADALGMDIGPMSADLFAHAIAGAATVFWNGPMGVFEMDAFSSGTFTVAEALTRVPGLSVVGGGDSAAAVRSFGFEDNQFGHISTGGGASLEYLEGKDLPGVEALQG